MTESTTTLHKKFMDELREQRWDDHRFYHRSRVNQAFHLASACCFLTTYMLLFINPTAAAIFGWVIAMWPRQIGHFFFEPKGFDEANGLDFETKEAIKVGFNLKRKRLLFGAWLAVPAGLAAACLTGLLHVRGLQGYLHELGVLWLWLAGAGLLARTLWLCATRNLQTGVVWFTKILTDPFHDVKIYCRAPLHLLRGEWFEPATHQPQHDEPQCEGAPRELRA
jgi:Protein of unknown function (DUF962)